MQEMMAGYRLELNTFIVNIILVFVNMNDVKHGCEPRLSWVFTTLYACISLSTSAECDLDTRKRAKAVASTDLSFAPNSCFRTADALHSCRLALAVSRYSRANFAKSRSGIMQP